MNEVRWGIIGCGDVTEVKSGPAFNLVPNSSLVAVMRRDAAKAEDYAKRHGVPKWYANADELIADSDINAVYIATPPSSHTDLALRCAKAGKPVYTEKPMDVCYARSLEMAEAFKAAGLPLLVAFYRRGAALYRAIKNMVESGVIGKVQTVSVEYSMRVLKEDLDESAQQFWRIDPAVSGGGHFMDRGCHTMDILDYILGPISNASGRAVNHAGLYPAPDCVSGWFEFESGVLGSCLWNFCANEDKDVITIFGSKGKIEFAFMDMSRARVTVDGVTTEYIYDVPKHAQLPLITEVVGALTTGSECCSTAETALRTMRVMDLLLGRTV